MKAHEETASSILFFKKDLMKINAVSAPTALLSAILEEAPASKPYGLALWAGLAAEIYFRSGQVEGEEATKALKEDLQMFLKSGHATVKLCKKDMPQDIMSKMEKLNKDWSVAAQTKDQNESNPDRPKTCSH